MLPGVARRTDTTRALESFGRSKKAPVPSPWRADSAPARSRSTINGFSMFCIALSPGEGLFWCKHAAIEDEFTFSSFGFMH